MSNSNLKTISPGKFIEEEYQIENEAWRASLFTTGNGYLGVRGSFEEYGSTQIQGAFIRGVIDQIAFFEAPIADNLYLKKFYFNEDVLRSTQTHESVVNIGDILLFRIFIGGEQFLPWEGKIISWEREFDIENATLRRKVVWESPKGARTEIIFERFASYGDKHIYAMRVTVTPLDHSQKIRVVSGLDPLVKSKGQIITEKISASAKDNTLFYSQLSGELYKHTISIGVINNVYVDGTKEKTNWTLTDKDNIFAQETTLKPKKGTSYIFEKTISLASSRDEIGSPDDFVSGRIKKYSNTKYETLLNRHKSEWKKYFKNIDIKINGDESADLALRFSNYHTAISFDRDSSIHSLGPKGLTGEGYNNFVWWDCEVYQAPVFFQALPDHAKNILIYRHRMLSAARENARKEGRKGARFPFTSSVTGEETVYPHVRHPFMQFHVVADTGWGVLQYLRASGDDEFMVNYGMELLFEISRYWLSRATYDKKKARYEILEVTGPDEHHPYVDNNAYTNYLVQLVISQTIKLHKKYGTKIKGLVKKLKLSDSEIMKWKDFSQSLYLPYDEESGLVPQFDGYFKLSRGLEAAPGRTAKSFQMKSSGMYNSSQVIKQPDALLLFSYLGLDFSQEDYARNFDYYRTMCESSSSLSYSVHSVCASDLDQPLSAYNYFMKAARIDLDDDHAVSVSGIHSACAAGSWLAVVRGIAGIIYREDFIELTPHMIPWWKSIELKLVWHGNAFDVRLDNKEMLVKASKDNKSSLKMVFKMKKYNIKPGTKQIFNLK